MKIVVLYTGDSTGEKNRIFQMEAVGLSRYIWGWPHLYEECEKQGITLMTSDIYFAMPERPPAILFYHSIHMRPLKNLLKEKNLYPAVLAFHEGPLYGCFIFWNLKRFSSKFDHIFLPRGASERISPRSTFHPHVDPLPYDRNNIIVGGFSSRKYLLLINRNTRMNPMKLRFARIAQALRPFKTFDPRELYFDRLRAIRYFADSNNGDFDLYGHFWEQPIPYSSHATEKKYRGAIQKSYRGEVDDKMELLKKYKFSICFENTIFGGYVTEKIFDSMFSGCIPVYWGAPDITDFVPANTFIDFRKFKDYKELDQYLRNIDQKTYDQYIANINEFLRSDRYYRMGLERHSEEMITVFKSYFEN